MALQHTGQMGFWAVHDSQNVSLRPSMSDMEIYHQVCKIRSRIWTKRAAVGHTLKPRLRLMRRRIRQRRVRRVQVLAAVWATALFLAEWAGWRSKLTWGAPRQLQDIWWHLPVLFGVFFALCMLWPWRLDSYDDI